MPDTNTLLASPSTGTAIDSQVNATATATVSAPATTQSIYITSIAFSFNGTPSAAVSVTLTDTAATQRGRWEVPAAAGQPWQCQFQRPLRIAAGKGVSLALPALGASIRGTVQLHYFVAGA
jgi:hypothetical protein